MMLGTTLVDEGDGTALRALLPLQFVPSYKNIVSLSLKVSRHLVSDSLSSSNLLAANIEFFSSRHLIPSIYHVILDQYA